MEEHAVDGVEGDEKEVVEEEERLGRKGGEKGDGTSDGRAAELEVLEATGSENFQVRV